MTLEGKDNIQGLFLCISQIFIAVESLCLANKSVFLMKSCKFGSLALLVMGKTLWEHPQMSWKWGHSLQQGRESHRQGPKLKWLLEILEERGKIFRKIKDNASLDSNSFIQEL